ncbi:MAG: FG-GAP repeat protein, partial [Phycisphaerae bacterium]
GVLDTFGLAIAWSGDALLIGARYDDTAAEDAGAVYVFREIAGVWTLVDTLLPEPAESRQWFGSSIAVDASTQTLLIGAGGEDSVDTDSGAAYVYASNGAGGWTSPQRLVPTELVVRAKLGETCAIDGDVLALGAPFENNEMGGVAGTVYVYERDGLGVWQSSARIVSSFPFDGGLFGSGLDVRGDTIVVGAPFLGLSFVPGFAYVFRRDAGGTWTTPQVIENPFTPQARDRFGTSVLLIDDALVVGSPRVPPPLAGMFSTWASDAGGPYAGVGFHFADDSTYNDRLGVALAFSNGTLAVAANNHADIGAAYLYNFNAATHLAEYLAKIVPPDGGVGDSFGSEIAMRGDLIAIGSPFHDEIAEDSGAVYVYRLVPGPIGDVDGDCDVDLGDLALLLTRFGTAAAIGDLDGNGFVDLTDLAMLLTNFGTQCD